MRAHAGQFQRRPFRRDHIRPLDRAGDLWGVVLTALAAAALRMRGNGTLMVTLGMAVVIAAYVLAVIGFNLLINNGQYGWMPENGADAIWYFTCVALGTLGIMVSAIYCWFRWAGDD